MLRSISDAFLSVTSASSCDRPEAGLAAKLATATPPLARNLLRVATVGFVGMSIIRYLVYRPAEQLRLSKSKQLWFPIISGFLVANERRFKDVFLFLLRFNFCPVQPRSEAHSPRALGWGTRAVRSYRGKIHDAFPVRHCRSNPGSGGTPRAENPPRGAASAPGFSSPSSRPGMFDPSNRGYATSLHTPPEDIRVV